MIVRRLAWLVAPCAFAAGCAGDPALPAEEARGAVIVGLSSDLVPGVDLSRLGVEMRAGGELYREATLSVSGGTPLVLPTEMRFDALPDGAPVEITLRAFDDSVSFGEPFLTRVAATRVVAGKTLLLRVRLEQECIPNFQLEGDLIAPTCAPPTTCVAAACEDPFVAPEKLEDYRADWATSYVDACKPAEHGEPEVTIGEGESGYSALAEGAALRLEKGEQGGFHLWVALKMRNLHRRGSATTISAYLPELGRSFDPIKVGYAYDPLGDGACEVHGIRYLLVYDQPGALDAIVGKALRLSAKVVDDVGDAGFAELNGTLTIDP